MGGPIFNQPVEGKDDGVRQFGVGGFSDINSAVYGNTDTGWGVKGTSSSSGVGVSGWSFRGIGVSASAFGPKSIGVVGRSPFYIGMAGWSYYDTGVLGESDNGVGVRGDSPSGVGVEGYSSFSVGVRGKSDGSDAGVEGYSYSGVGVRGTSNRSAGVQGISDTTSGVYGSSPRGFGIRGRSDSGYGVYGDSYSGYGVYGHSIENYAAFLEGDVKITGNLEKAGGSFKIDHPLDAANKYLSHSFVESPDMKNVYDGVVVLDDKGEAEIELPDWFGALNKDFRYQLTAIGAPGPNLYIAEEISGAIASTDYSGGSRNNNNNNNNSRFKIAGGNSGMKVSWQVTGIRRDPWANANRIEVEEDKPAKERGYYIYPELYGQPAEKRISRLLLPEEEEKWQELLINENKVT